MGNCFSSREKGGHVVGNNTSTAPAQAPAAQSRSKSKPPVRPATTAPGRSLGGNDQQLSDPKTAAAQAAEVWKLQESNSIEPVRILMDWLFLGPATEA